MSLPFFAFLPDPVSVVDSDVDETPSPLPTVVLPVEVEECPSRDVAGEEEGLTEGLGLGGLRNRLNIPRK